MIVNANTLHFSIPGLISVRFHVPSGQSPSEDSPDGRLERRDGTRVRLLHVQPSFFCQSA